MDFNSAVSSLHIPQLITQTSDLRNDLYNVNNLESEPRNDVYDELSSWMDLLETITQFDLSSDETRHLLEEGQAHCSKYAVALSGINQNLDTVKASWDSGMSFMAVQELQTLRGSLQVQRMEMEKWIVDVKLISNPQDSVGVDSLQDQATGVQQDEFVDATQSTMELQQDPVAPDVAPDPAATLSESVTEIQQQQQPDIANVQEATTDIPEPVSSNATGGKNKKKKNKKKKKGQQANAVQEAAEPDVAQEPTENIQQSAVDASQESAPDVPPEITDITQEPIQDVVQPTADAVDTQQESVPDPVPQTTVDDDFPEHSGDVIQQEPVAQGEQQNIGTELQEEPSSEIIQQTMVGISPEQIGEVQPEQPVAEIQEKEQEPEYAEAAEAAAASTTIHDQQVIEPQDLGFNFSQEQHTLVGVPPEQSGEVFLDLATHDQQLAELQEPVLDGAVQQPEADIPQEPPVDTYQDIDVVNTLQMETSDVLPVPSAEDQQELGADTQQSVTTEIQQEPVLEIVQPDIQESFTDAQQQTVDCDQDTVLHVTDSGTFGEESIIDVQQNPPDIIHHESTVDIEHSETLQEPVVDLQQQFPEDIQQEPVLDVTQPVLFDSPQESITEIQQQPEVGVQQPSLHAQEQPVDSLQSSVMAHLQLVTENLQPFQGAVLQQQQQHQLGLNVPQQTHTEMAEKLRAIGFGLDAVITHINTLRDISPQELDQARELLTGMVDQYRSELQAFSQDFDQLPTMESSMANLGMMNSDVRTVGLAETHEMHQNIGHSDPDSTPVEGTFVSALSTFDSETVQNDTSTVWATPLWAPSHVPDDINREQNVFDYLDQADGGNTPTREDYMHSRDEFVAEIAELILSAVQTVDIVPEEDLDEPAETVIESPELVVSEIHAINIDPVPESEPEPATNVDFQDRPDTTHNDTETAHFITSSSLDTSMRMNSFDTVDVSSSKPGGFKRPEMIDSSAQTIELKPEPPLLPSAESSDRKEKSHYTAETNDRKEKTGRKTRAQIGSDHASRSIIARDTQRVASVFSKIIAGSYKKTGVSLGVLEVDGKDWASQFCEDHRYLNGILMAITIPKRLFLWHTLNIPVDEETWTKGSLVRTVSMVTESPRHLHSYPFRLTRYMPPDMPKLLLHWDLTNCGEPEVSARFKELVRAGGELQRRIGNFSYKQMVVCITLPWSLVQGQVSGKIPAHQDKALEFLDDMGILSVIPVDEKVDGQVRERDWCPSSIKMQGSEQSITAYLQETTFTGSPELDPPMQATPTRFVVVTVRKGEVDDWLDAVGCSLGLNSRSIRYPVVNDEVLDYDHLRRYYRNAINPNPSASKVG
ncbi:hypothetical protein BGZ63DRAFT_467766 [Mariannaea sp. PMI_226]|nr:hypothetical protein BGZ63DRAFT_467766 [Mariannaea sp. PMI_226]